MPRALCLQLVLLAGSWLLGAACGGITQQSEDVGAGSAGSPSAGGESTSAGGGSTSAGGGSTSAGSGGLAAAGAPSCGPSTMTSFVPECRGYRVGMPCRYPGFACDPLPCGLADLGCRTCSCEAGGQWSCTACDLSNFPWDQIVEQPARDCRVQDQESVACELRGDWCRAGSEVCLCWTGDDGRLVWDCELPPPGPGSW